MVFNGTSLCHSLVQIVHRASNKRNRAADNLLTLHKTNTVHECDATAA